MPSILNLKFKGNKSFVAFSNLGDTESLTKTWKICTKVAMYLEQGQRLENLSWRLWHLQNLMVDTDNARSKREFRKLSKTMSDKLDKEKGRSIEELEAPDFKRNSSTEIIRQRAVEKERTREASLNMPGTIKRMQFTFSVDNPAPAAPNAALKKPDLKPSSEFKDTVGKRGRAAAARPAAAHGASDVMHVEEEHQPKFSDQDVPLTQRGRKHVPAVDENKADRNASLRFPSLFSNDFGPSALLYPSPSVAATMNYGEGVAAHANSDGFSIIRPTIELPLDELLSTVDSMDDSCLWPTEHGNELTQTTDLHDSHLNYDRDVIMNFNGDLVSELVEEPDVSEISEEMELESLLAESAAQVPPISQSVREALPLTIAPSKIGSKSGTGSRGRPSLTVKTQPASSSTRPGATATSLNPANILRTNINAGPGGVKAECSNCGATHTPLWRRGLHDELNCNACGLYCKLHKRPRPRTMRSSHGETRAQATPRQESVDVMAQCHNCHTTTTPLWRKDDGGKTVCNACGLYYKLHGSSRPISMKSDVIRKRSRHDARRAGPETSETPSASPGASRRPSPAVEQSPILAPDSTTQMSYDYKEEPEIHSTPSELMGALGQDNGNAGNVFSPQGTYSSVYNSFPGPYHPDYLSQNYRPLADALPFSTIDTLEAEASENDARVNKRRRMSTDSASEPPSSAVSFSSYADGYSTRSSATSQSPRSSLDFPFFASYDVYRGSSSAFWHPPMMPQDRSPYIHPPMLPTADDAPMDFLHPPMLPQDDDNLFSAYLHPPMLPTEECPSSSSNAMHSHSHSHSHQHPPVFSTGSVYSGTGNSQNDFYDSAMRTY